MLIKSQKDFFAGLLFIAIGLGFAWGATDYELGGTARMGPGYFPMALGALLAALGAVIAFKALVIETADGEPVGRWAWRPLFFVTLANVLFGVLLGGAPWLGLPPMGLIAAVYALVLVASLASRELRLKESLALATVLALGCWGAFVVGLKLPFQVWPAFISG